MGLYNTYFSEHIHWGMKSQRFKNIDRKVTRTRNEKSTQKFGQKA